MFIIYLHTYITGQINLKEELYFIAFDWLVHASLQLLIGYRIDESVFIRLYLLD